MRVWEKYILQQNLLPSQRVWHKLYWPYVAVTPTNGGNSSNTHKTVDQWGVGEILMALSDQSWHAWSEWGRPWDVHQYLSTFVTLSTPKAETTNIESATSSIPPVLKKSSSPTKKKSSSPSKESSTTTAIVSAAGVGIRPTSAWLLPLIRYYMPTSRRGCKLVWAMHDSLTFMNS